MADQSLTRRETEVLTFGCRLNAYESEIVRRHAESAGLDGAVVVNTCGVTSEAVRQARQAIRRARRRRPEALVVVTGCAAQVDPEAFASMSEVDAVVGNAEKLRRETWERAAAGAAPRVDAGPSSELRELPEVVVDGVRGRTRPFVQVQGGCDHDCTFCIIPQGRGPSRSVSAERVVAQVRRLVETGHAEVVLTGVDTTSWGSDLPGRPALGDLVASVLAGAPDLRRLRLSSVDAVELDERLLRLFAEEERLAPFLHLSLQSGDDLVLRRMKRRHLRADAVELCRRVRQLRPDAYFGADLIAGFPTESEAAFSRSLALVDDCDLTFLHVFPFSPREGTPAARMPQVPRRVVRERAARLREKGAEALSRGLERLVGRVEEVLLEGNGRGRTAHFAPVRLRAPAPGGAGELVRARLLRRDGEVLVGRREADGGGAATPSR